MAASLEDVARSAGVSVATVSRVFNSRPNVAANTRAIVAEAIERLGYGGQQRLAADRHRLVGILCSDPESTLLGEIARSITESLAVQGVSVVLLYGGGSDIPDERAVEIFVERRVSGVVFLGGREAVIDLGQPPYSSLKNVSIAVVSVGGAGESKRIAAMVWDDSTTIRTAVDRLYLDGHESIGYLARRDNWISVRNRIDSFHASLADSERDGSLTGSVERCSSTIESAELVTERILDGGATGLICETDWMAIGALRSARRMGRRVPEDVAIVSCEDSRVLAELDPAITAVRQPVEAIGRAAAAELLRQLGGQRALVGQQSFSPDLVVRTASVRRSIRELSRR